ncbi:MAG TPA: universal stress protein [Casimicrobiaceae bacterium]|nr:universal stress protein [Casimicrobiaceae bacterium]
MTYRAIVVHMDGSEANARRLATAVRLARAYHAELIGVYLVAEPNITPFTAAVMPGAERALQDEYDLERAVERAFRDACTGAGIESIDWRSPAGDPYRAAAAQTRGADLAILAQPAGDAGSTFSAGLAHAVLMESGRPVLFVPSASAVTTLGQRALIAWNDSREAARAVADALPLLKDARSVHAVAVTATSEETLDEQVSDSELSAFLVRHAVATRVERIGGNNLDAGEVLLSHAADLGADLIVMGGYSRPRIRELVWGGVTRTMLEKMTVPVLMAH